LTASDAATRSSLTEERNDQWVYALVACCLLAALILLPFLPEEVAADTAVRAFVVLLLLIAGIDLFTLRVPNALIYPLLIMVLLALIQRGAMGMGDVKAACFSGCILGLKGGVFSILFGFAVAGLIALPVVILGIRNRKDVLPLAPFLIVGAFISYAFWGFVLPGAL
jgi:leader peptidase (prepilin peptidase)/N-methyltransferase